MSLPVELMTLGVSTIAGGAMKLMGMVQESRAKQSEALMAMANSNQTRRVELANTGTPQYQWTRRVIALMVVASVMVLPKLAVLAFPDLPVTYGWTSADSGLWFWLFGGEQLTWHVAQGVVITPLDTNFAMAIAGLYFGSATVSR